MEGQIADGIRRNATIDSVHAKVSIETLVSPKTLSRTLPHAHTIHVARSTDSFRSFATLTQFHVDAGGSDHEEMYVDRKGADMDNERGVTQTVRRTTSPMT
ncbi:hypothetical protein HDU98_006949 [Podochytrium sp. JEL0797]|nr:hypothetical protein HDU98_006949 [Podochytrium sp. JEL0797]